MQNLFQQYDETMNEKFEIIFDRAKNYKMALENAVDYYLLLTDSGVEVDIETVIDIASNYGYDISNEEFEKMVEENY